MKEKYKVQLDFMGPADGNFSSSRDSAWNMFNDFLIANDIEMVLEKPPASAYYASFYGTKEALEQMIWDFFNPGSWREDYPIDYSNDDFASLIYHMERVEEDNGKLREARYLYKINEASNVMKITHVTVEPRKIYDRKIYDIYDRSIVVKAKINGLSSEFVFEAASAGNIWFTGIDCNEAIINGKRTKISNGGGQTHYALQIPVSVLNSAPNEKQKNFRFTGQEYSTAPIVPAFKEALQNLFKKGELTQEFLKAIGYNRRILKESVKDKDSKWVFYDGKAPMMTIAGSKYMAQILKVKNKLSVEVGTRSKQYISSMIDIDKQKLKSLLSTIKGEQPPSDEIINMFFKSIL